MPISYAYAFVSKIFIYKKSNSKQTNSSNSYFVKPYKNKNKIKEISFFLKYFLIGNTYFQLLL